MVLLHSGIGIVFTDVLDMRRSSISHGQERVKGYFDGSLTIGEALIKSTLCFPSSFLFPNLKNQNEGAKSAAMRVTFQWRSSIRNTVVIVIRSFR